MELKRILRHLSTGRGAARRAFPPRALEAIESAVRAVEAHNDGQIRFAVEAALELPALLAGQTARQRAIEVFSRLRVWDTERNNGVLIYLLMADHKVEIVADRGIHAKLGQAVWDAVCRDMETAFGGGEFERGVISGIHAVGAEMARHFPADPNKKNEMDDSPVLL